MNGIGNYVAGGLTELQAWLPRANQRRRSGGGWGEEESAGGEMKPASGKYSAGVSGAGCTYTSRQALAWIVKFPFFLHNYLAVNATRVSRGEAKV